MKKKISSCVIIAVGDEVLYGDTVNSNGAVIARNLDDIGIRALYQLTVPDDEEAVGYAVRDAIKAADVVVLCGGLGPTDDDITKEAFCRQMGLKLLENEEVADRNRRLFEHYKIEMTPNNIKQAFIPEGAEAIMNENGTAPGIFLEYKEKYFVLLPGPPGENIPMLTDFVIPRLRREASAAYAEKYYMLDLGEGESYTEQLIRDNIPTGGNYTLNTYVGNSSIRLKATAYAESEEEALRIIEKGDIRVKELFAERIFAQRRCEIPELVCEKLLEMDLKVSCAESCTGGLIAACFTDYPGISQVFMGGAITYSNEAKMDILGVKKSTIDEFTELSEQTAMEMALGAAKLYKTDIAVSTTGIAGPGGGTPEKPVGLVYTGIYYKGSLYAEAKRYRGNRDKVRRGAMAGAFELIRRKMIENKDWEKH